MKELRYGQRLKMVVRDGHQYLVTLQKNKRFETHHGFIPHEDIVAGGWGREHHFQNGERVFALPCGIIDTVLKLERRTQIVYPKDMGFIGLLMDIKSGDRIIEAGMGSGCMSIFLSRMIGDSGALYTYERNQDFLRIGMANLRKEGTLHRVVFHCRDLDQGVIETEVDGCFLDVPDPQNHIHTLHRALKNGGHMVVVCPTFNQCQQVLARSQQLGFMEMGMWEMLHREYKVNPDRIRPQDRMVAHTTFIINGKKSQETNKNMEVFA